ncbi:AAA family ATPase [Cellulosimicrobium protaetiae]|uniref:AAA family ATPase n=1 Tax=Cellulosimicrobium protaetiae TaxID=2587808 RepID=UPI0020A45181|nr:AAA family ATPase [Cellulosimicrobium protaetiae]
MLLLGPDDDVVARLGRVPRRIAVAGVSGAGKTTLARSLGARLGIPYTELDALHHGPAWTPRPAFLDDVRTLVAQDAFVTEWQYTTARPLVLARAEVLVWLDLPTRVTMRQVVTRTVRRSVRREVLWNGNVEPPLWRTWYKAPDENIVRWAWSTRHQYRDLPAVVARDAPDVVVVRLRTRRESAQWLAGLPADAR